jgi:hypothetical protein
MPSTVIQGLKLFYPDEFEVSRDFPGLIEQSATTSVVVTSIPGPIHEVLAGFTPERMQAHGMRWIGQESVLIAGLSATLVHATQAQCDMQFVKWIAVVGSDERTKLVTATVPQHLASDQRDKIRNILTSISFAEDSREAEAIAGIAISIEPPFALAEASGAQAIYTRQGQFPVLSNLEPLLIVSTLLRHLPPEERQQFAQDRVHETVQVSEVTIREQNVLALPQWQGFEIVADAISLPGNEPVFIYQVTLHSEGRSVILQGLSAQSEEAELLPVFQRAARTLRRVDVAVT